MNLKWKYLCIYKFTNNSCAWHKNYVVSYLVYPQPDLVCLPPTLLGWRNRPWPGSSCQKLCVKGSQSYCCPAQPSGAAWSGPGGTLLLGVGMGGDGGFLCCCSGHCVSASLGNCHIALKKMHFILLWVIVTMMLRLSTSLVKNLIHFFSLCRIK